MRFILLIREGGVLVGRALPKVPCECTQCEAVNRAIINPIRTLEIKSDLVFVRCYEANVGIVVLVVAENHSIAILSRKPRDDWKQHQFDDFGDDLGVYRYRINVPVNVNEPFDHQSFASAASASELVKVFRQGRSEIIQFTLSSRQN